MEASTTELELKAKEVIKTKFNAITKIDHESMQALLDLLRVKTYKKNEIIIEENEKMTDFYFIYKGVIRIYFYKKDKIIIERFEKEGGFFGGNYEHLSKYPGVHIIEALEDLVVLKMKHSELELLFKKHHAVETLYRMLLEAFHYNYVDKLYALKSSSSEERYADFMKEYGDIMNRISLKNVASYLSMTSETISRIRSRYDKREK